MDEVAEDPAVAGFAARYRGGLDQRDALRWARDPLAPGADGDPSPGTLLERRRRELYRGSPDAAAVAAFTRDLTDWEQELALARAALDPGPAAVEAPPPVGVATVRRGWGRRAAAAAGVVAVVALGVVIVAHVTAGTVGAGPVVAAGVPGVLVAHASAARGARSGSGLDGADHYVTVVVTCQGDGGVRVRLSDGTDARFACISAFPRTAVQPSTGPLRRFGYRVDVRGDPNWAMTLSR